MEPISPYPRVHILPSLLTIGNFACGFFSIVFCLNALFFSTRGQTMEKSTDSVQVSAVAMAVSMADAKGTRDNEFLSSPKGSLARSSYLLQWACVIIFIGMLFDMLDGRVARMMGASSEFGKELDSLADITTFGVAPPIIVNSLWISVMPVTSSWWGQVLIFGAVYAACAMLRLARYNVESGTADKNIFTGLPSPAAAGCVVTAVMVAYGDYPAIEAFCRYLDALIGPGMNAFQVKVNILGLFLIVPGLLMVSSIPFVHVSNRYLSGKKSFTLLVLAVILLALLWQEPRIVMFLLFNGYMVWGVVAAARKKWLGKKDPIIDEEPQSESADGDDTA